MYAVIETGGKQYRVEVGTELEVELLDGDAGASIKVERVLLVADGDTAAPANRTRATVEWTIPFQPFGEPIEHSIGVFVAFILETPSHDDGVVEDEPDSGLGGAPFRLGHQ